MGIFSFLNRSGKGHLKFGLDIRSDGIAVVRSTGNILNEKLELDICAFRPLSEGQNHAALLADTVKEFKLSKTPCCAVLQPEYYNLMQVEAPDVPPEELKAAVRWRIKDIIDFHIDDAVIDVFEVPGQRNQRLHLLYVVVAKKPHIEGFANLITHAGIDLDVIDIPELVLRNISAATFAEDKSTSLLYLGHDSGKIIINQGLTMMFSRSIDLGVTKIIETTNSADPDLIEAGILPDELIDVFDSIVLELQRSLDYYDSNWSGSVMDSTLLLPTEQTIPSLMPHIFNTLGGVINLFDVNKTFHLNTEVTPEEQSRCLCALGAALRRSSHLKKQKAAA